MSDRLKHLNLTRQEPTIRDQAAEKAPTAATVDTADLDLTPPETPVLDDIQQAAPAAASATGYEARRHARREARNTQTSTDKPGTGAAASATSKTSTAPQAERAGFHNPKAEKTETAKETSTKMPKWQKAGLGILGAVAAVYLVVPVALFSAISFGLLALGIKYSVGQAIARNTAGLLKGGGKLAVGTVSKGVGAVRAAPGLVWKTLKIAASITGIAYVTGVALHTLYDMDRKDARPVDALFNNAVSVGNIFGDKAGHYGAATVENAPAAWDAAAEKGAPIVDKAGNVISDTASAGYDAAKGAAGKAQDCYNNSADCASDAADSVVDTADSVFGWMKKKMIAGHTATCDWAYEVLLPKSLEPEEGVCTIVGDWIYGDNDKPLATATNPALSSEAVQPRIAAPSESYDMYGQKIDDAPVTNETEAERFAREQREVGLRSPSQDSVPALSETESTAPTSAAAVGTTVKNAFYSLTTHVRLCSENATPFISERMRAVSSQNPNAATDYTDYNNTIIHRENVEQVIRTELSDPNSALHKAIYIEAPHNGKEVVLTYPNFSAYADAYRERGDLTRAQHRAAALLDPNMVPQVKVVEKGSRATCPRDGTSWSYTNNGEIPSYTVEKFVEKYGNKALLRPDYK